MKSPAILLAVAAFTSSTAAHAQVFRTVSLYDAATHANVVDVALPSAAFYAAFKADVAAAHAGNRGGVVNFDKTETVPWPSAPAAGVWSARYGVALSNVATLSFGNPVTVANMVAQPWTPVSGSPNAPGALVAAGPTSVVIKVSALKPIKSLGLTVLQRVGVRQKVVVNFTEASGATTSLSSLLGAAAAGAVPFQDTFFGANAAPGGSFAWLEVRCFDAGTGALLAPAIDDLAFVTE